VIEHKLSHVGCIKHCVQDIGTQVLHLPHSILKVVASPTSHIAQQPAHIDTT